MANSTKETVKQSSGAGRESDSQSAYAFRFVEVGEPSQTRDEDARSLIRSHVMRDFYERRDNRKRPSTLPEKTSAASKKEGAAQQTHRFKVGPQGLQEIKKRGRKSHSLLQEHKTSFSSATALHKPERRVRTSSVVPNLGPVEPATTSRPSSAQFDKPATVEPDLRQPPEYDMRMRPESVFTRLGIDPFNTLPLSRSPRTHVLLYHATRGVLSSRLMGQLRTEWLSLATQDAALFHVALSHYAGNYGLVHQESDPIEALRFRMEAMRLVNQRLGHVENALADGTLGTVASLSSYEATNGSLTAISTHMKGLQRLVTLRGGLQVDMNPYTKRLILWADLNCANALGSDPVFDLVDNDGNPILSPPSSEVPKRGQTTNSRASHLSSLPSTKNLESLSSELKNNFTSLKQLANIDADIGGQTERCKEEKIRDSDNLYIAERSLLILANTWGPGKFATSGCIAATIFLDNHLRGVGFNARLMDRLVTRLQFSMNMVLNDISRHNANDKTARAILWVLYVGGTAAGGRPEREWFITQLPDFCDNLGLKTWEEAQLILKDFLWAPSWQSQGRLLWMQVEEMRLLKNIVWPTADDMMNTDMGLY
ncbi:hypothetical protein BKA65DRAFT_547316 [Rhexocercosporidium sp. MPI-PUGE-AT-0058]|nr:hypothetical protein BKA65DRAFT_547316 [Rhexocercosporidium sp. MPI-PUGE-AT-0058]